ncbi:hypothetical protein RQP46_002304 [Phenoliferia psychrophenolica]
MSEISFLRDFKFPLKIESDRIGQKLEMVPLKDTRAPFNSGTWVAHVTLEGGSAIYQLVWKNVDPSVLSAIEQLSIQFGSPEDAARSGEVPWGEEVQVTPDELNTLSASGLGSSSTAEHSLYGMGTCEAIVRIVWRGKDASNIFESAPTQRVDGPIFAALSSAFLLSPNPNNVRFIFSRDGGRELWASASVLAIVSPYFKKFFDSSTLDLPKPNPPTSHNASFSRSALAFDDSDDDDTLADPPLFAPESSKHPHHTIKITDFSYITYYAVLSWILSHQIDFRLRDATHKERSSTLPRPASPWSVYRLAHLLEIPELRALALAAIRSQVTVATVVADLFSETSGKYPAVLDVLCHFMVEHREEMRDAGCWEEIARMVKATPAWADQVVAKVVTGLL